MTKVKTTTRPEPQPKKAAIKHHDVPLKLKEQIREYQAAAETEIKELNDQIQQVNQHYGGKIQDLLNGFCASLDPEKQYQIGPDFQYLIEIDPD